MPAATSLIIAGASAAASAGQAIAANKRRKEADFAAKNAAAKLKGISETDYSAGLQVPTMGYDLAQQGVQQQVSTGIQALQDTGAAGVIGGLPTLTEQSNRANLELGADLQNQVSLVLLILKVCAKLGAWRRPSKSRVPERLV